MNDYPKALYRQGSQFEWEGLSLDSMIVDSADAEKAALADGWKASPFDDEKPKARKAK
jgi:hypothetical protein